MDAQREPGHWGSGLNTFRITVDRLVFLGNVPAGMNPLVLMSLAYTLRSSGEDPDPIVVRAEGPFFRVIDGRHRAIAAIIAGRPDVLARYE